MMIERITGGYLGGFSLKDISFQVKDGGMHALLGLNGSGKTTIIRMICGLLKTESGKVLIDGTDIFQLNEKARARMISYVPQMSGILYDISVLDVVLMGISPYLKMFQQPDQRHKEEAYRCLQMLGMGDIADANYQTLSGGQKQMVLISRALMQNGRYMILDEPDSSLDLINKNHLMRMVRKLTDTLGKGCLISMHDPEYALNYCDHIFCIKDGRISEIDLKKDDMKTIEKKLSGVYGPVHVVIHRGKYILYYP